VASLIAILSVSLARLLVERNETRAYYNSESRFSQLRSMLLAYYSEHGCFPPEKYRVTPNGPAHSWRVLLLPYIDGYTQNAFAKYDFSKEWNSPKNLAIIQSLRGYLGNFSLENYDEDIANYQTISDTGEWPSKVPLKAYGIRMGKDRFILIENPESDVPWAEPKF
jgi:hypothetical protein